MRCLFRKLRNNLNSKQDVWCAFKAKKPQITPNPTKISKYGKTHGGSLNKRSIPTNQFSCVICTTFKKVSKKNGDSTENNDIAFSEHKRCTSSLPLLQLIMLYLSLSFKRKYLPVLKSLNILLKQNFSYALNFHVPGLSQLSYGWNIGRWTWSACQIV